MKKYEVNAIAHYGVFTGISEIELEPTALTFTVMAESTDDANNKAKNHLSEYVEPKDWQIYLGDNLIKDWGSSESDELFWNLLDEDVA